MFKKIFGISILALLTAVLIFGAINRTQAKSSNRETTLQASEPGVYRQGNGLGSNKKFSQSGYHNQSEHDQQLLAGQYSQAEVDSGISISGTVASADSSQVTVTLSNGETVEIAGRAWSYARENGFSLQNGDLLRLTGFYENKEFEIGSIENLTSGVSIQIREPSGRPYWAGRGRQD